MKNLVNWMCLICVMYLIVQVMVHISNEVIADVNNSIKLNNQRKNKTKNVGNTKVNKKVG